MRRGSLLVDLGTGRNAVGGRPERLHCGAIVPDRRTVQRPHLFAQTTVEKSSAAVPIETTFVDTETLCDANAGR